MGYPPMKSSMTEDELARPLTANNATKTHCKHGHEFTAENTYRSRTSRVCRACKRVWDHQRRPERQPPITHCVRGHEYTAENTRWYGGKRRCRACNQFWSRTVKSAARRTLGDAVRSGRLARPAACGSCGDIGLIHGHHTDYRYPLDVQWLCRACHAATHRQLRVRAS